MFIPKDIKVKRGDSITADLFNALIDRLVRLERLNVQPPLELFDTVTNPCLSLSDFFLARRFQLTENLDRGDQASANIVTSDSNGNFTVNDGTEFTVYDPLNIITGNIDDRGYAVQLSDSGDLWEILRIQHPATWIYFRTKTTFSMTNESVEVDVLQYWGGYSPEAASAQSSNSSSSGDGSVLVYNLHHVPHDSSIYEFHGSDNLVGYAEYDNTRRIYRLIQLQCG